MPSCTALMRPGGVRVPNIYNILTYTPFGLCVSAFVQSSGKKNVLVSAANNYNTEYRVFFQDISSCNSFWH